ncbi:immunoglobulin-binding protein 1-like [Chaetodon trifascialis]|uniref:immunoglobulin-binding protein 1-like n=1 Tax=Chaetodon trifascialis TaxID=109706 RepID=UPI00399486E0
MKGLCRENMDWILSGVGVLYMAKWNGLGNGARQPVSMRTVRRWTREANESLQDCFEATDWNVLREPHGEDINSQTECITEYIKFCEQTILPTQTVCCFPYNKPWITSELKSLLNRKVFFRSFQKLRQSRDAYRRKLEAKPSRKVKDTDCTLQPEDYTPPPPVTSTVCFTADQSVTCSSDLISMAAQRQAKIERYRQKKELETRLSDVRRVVDSRQADDEVSRDFYILNLQRWVTLCLEEIESIDQEMEILKKMDGLKQGAAKQPTQPVRPPMKPFILTKDAVQAPVFGAGYPSLPTMTVDDWYEQHRKHGALPDQGLPRKIAIEKDTDTNEREEEEEKQAENDDESLLKARNWDEWKDTHRKGYGNRHNMR